MRPELTTNPRAAGWPGLFAAAFIDSRNAMVLVEASRRLVDVNGALLALTGHQRTDLIGEPIYSFVVGGPQMTVEEWKVAILSERFTGAAELRCADGSVVGIQWAATPEVVTGQRLVLGVALSTSRWGGRFRRTLEPAGDSRNLSPREVEVVRLVAHGRSGPEIAEDLQISHDTVRTHVRNAMIKTGARSRAQLVAKALAEGHAFG